MPLTGEVEPNAHSQHETLNSRSIATCYGDCERGFLNLDRSLGDCKTWDPERLGTIGLQSQEQVERMRQTLRAELLGRLRMWAGNCGAHRSGKASLDHRLREALHLYRQVIRLLENLEQALQEGIKSITTPILPASTTASHGQSSEAVPFYLSSAESDTSEEEDSAADGSNSSDLEPTPESVSGTESISPACTSDLEYALRDITHVLKCLYSFSTMLHRPIPVNRIKKCASIHVDEFKDDCAYVAARFEGAPEYLQERLGRANNKRRQLLAYYERHHRKIAQFLEPTPTVDQLYSESSESPEHQRWETLSETTAHTFHDLYTSINIAGTPTDDHTNVIFQRPVIHYDQESDSGRSETSYASTANESLFAAGGFRWRVPEPEHAKEHGFNDDPFQCPYCHDFIKAKNTKAWKSHVFSDLLPYVCTFEDCATPDRLYHSRGEWFEHESQVHRREWYCEACNQVFPTKDDMFIHINDSHLNEFAKSQHSLVVKWCERAITSKQICPLCPRNFLPLPQHLQRFHRNDIGGELIDFDVLSGKMPSEPKTCPHCPVKYNSLQLRRHLADHLQQLALFVLPRSMDDEEEGTDEEPDNASQDDLSVSGLGSEDGQGSERDRSNPAAGDEDEFVQVLKDYYERVRSKGTNSS